LLLCNDIRTRTADISAALEAIYGIFLNPLVNQSCYTAFYTVN